MPATRQVYVTVSDSWMYNDEEMVPTHLGPILAFSTRAQAEEYLRRCEDAEQALPGGGDRSYSVVEMIVQE
jgi:hypothetical protein